MSHFADHIDPDEDEPGLVWRSLDPMDYEEGTGDMVITIDEFVSSVAHGYLTDDDGFGECARVDVDAGIEVSNRRIYPSNLERPLWTTHVVWYPK